MLMDVGEIRNPANAENPLHIGGKERKQFYYWISIKPDHNVCHRQPTDEITKAEEKFPIFVLPSGYNPLWKRAQD